MTEDPNRYMLKALKLLKRILSFLLLIILLGFLIPQNLSMPVENATKKDYNKKSFWFYPWGNSVTHKGVDIFSKKGTKIRSSTIGIVIYQKQTHRGGKSIIILGPKWRFHYYAHLDKILIDKYSVVNHETVIGTVGNSGNARGKAPHLHYSIYTLIPYPWRIDDSPQGQKKMHYLNPIDFLEK